MVHDSFNFFVHTRHSVNYNRERMAQMMLPKEVFRI